MIAGIVATHLLFSYPAPNGWSSVYLLRRYVSDKGNAGDTCPISPQWAGIDMGGYSSHSFRIGAASTAAQAGVEGFIIKMLGRLESSAHRRCLRTPRESLTAISARLVSNSH